MDRLQSLQQIILPKVTTAVYVDVYFWQLSLKDNKETWTELMLGHLSDPQVFGMQA